MFYEESYKDFDKIETCDKNKMWITLRGSLFTFVKAFMKSD